MTKMRWVSGMVLFASVVLISTAPFDDFFDLRGPYCAVRSICCLNRDDSCSMPILGTLCYCDQFCNETRVEDCCPDYWEHCLGYPGEIVQSTTTPPPPPPQTCIYKGVVIPLGNTYLDNCNICKCEVIGRRREVICENNVCLIQEDIIQTINGGLQYGWRASNYSEFWGKTLDRGIQLRLGTLLPERAVLKANAVRKIYDPAELPREFDARKVWPTYISPIQDQGWCGSSWAISTAAVASDRYAIISKGLEQVQLSAQNLLSCDNKKRHQNCDGGHLDRAWVFARRNGLVEEDCFPYRGQDVPCTIRREGNLVAAGCRPPRNGDRKGRYRVTPAYRLGNETDIMYEITTSGPVQATMRVYHDFYSYNTGIYRHTDLSLLDKTGYLSVRIVGWGEEYTDQGLEKYWLVANSWGTNWGEDGYFRILRGTNESDIETFVLATWPEVNRKLLVTTQGNNI